MANPAKDAKDKTPPTDDRKPAPREEEKAHAVSHAHAAPGIDLESLTDEQLSALIASAEAALTGRQAKKQGDFLASIREQALKLGLDPAAIAVALGKGGGKRARAGRSGDARATVKPKYRNPANHAQTGAGRGAKPAWIEVGADGKPLALALKSGNFGAPDFFSKALTSLQGAA